MHDSVPTHREAHHVALRARRCKSQSVLALIGGCSARRGTHAVEQCCAGCWERRVCRHGSGAEMGSPGLGGGGTSAGISIPRVRAWVQDGHHRAVSEHCSRAGRSRGGQMLRTAATGVAVSPGGYRDREPVLHWNSDWRTLPDSHIFLQFDGIMAERRLLRDRVVEYLGLTRCAWLARTQPRS